MMKCPICNKSKSAFEMRPIVNAEELKVGAALSEQPTEQEVAGEKVDVVCRDCWMTLLKSRSKEEIIEIMETICGILMEVDNRMKSKAPFGTPGDFILEKGSVFPDIHIQPPGQLWRDGVGVASDKIIWNGTGEAPRWEDRTQPNAGNTMTLTNGFIDWFNSLCEGGDSRSSNGG